jgi:thymidylate synthase
MQSYLNLLEHIMSNGKDRSDRTGVGTRSVFGYQFRHNVSEGFPLLTTKRIFWKGVVAELLWFLSGVTNVNTLIKQGVHIWDAWADNVTGELGPVYGHQWRKWEGCVDQISALIEGIKKSPDSRRHIVTAWNPAEIPEMKLPPCHPFWQCQVDNGKLHLSLYMRSCDAFLGAPFNIASYALLIELLAHFTDLNPGELIISFGDLHVYSNHFEQVKEQLSRPIKPLPKFRFFHDREDNSEKTIFDVTPEWFEIYGYEPHPPIKAPIAV